MSKRKKHSKFQKLQIIMAVIMAVITLAGIAAQVFATLGM